MPSVRTILLIVVCLAGSAVVAAPASDPAPGRPALWLHSDENVRTLEFPDDSVQAGPTEVWQGWPWYESLPEAVLDTLDGSRFDLATTRGSVTLVSFWASWCAPCRIELPHLQELVDGHEGLTGLAINAEETPEVARTAAEEIGIRMPVLMLDAALRAKVRIGSLPVLLLVDRDGRIRHRWDGYQTGQERAVKNLALGLVRGEDPLEPSDLARVLEGAGSMRVLWSHQIPDATEGVAVVRGDGDRPPRVVVNAGRSLRAYLPDGRASGIAAAPAGMGLLRAGDFTGDGRVDLVGFRAGSARVVGLDLATRMKAAADLDAPAMDVGIRENPGPSGMPILAATRGGLAFLSSDVRVAGVLQPGALSLAVHGSRAWVLGVDERVLAVDLTSGAVDEIGSAPPQAGGIATAADGHEYAVFHEDVRDVVTGHFRSKDDLEWAYATSDGRLIIVGAAGRIVAEWPGIVQIVAHDLDGDGLDELVVAAGQTVTVLGVTGSSR